MSTVSFIEKLRGWKRPEEDTVRIPVTTRYPFTDTEKPPEYRGAPWIDPALCIGCTACVNVCPSDALSAELDYENGKKRIILNIARCIRCYYCVEVCPTRAMKGTINFELATPDKRDLVEVVEHNLYRCPRCGRYEDYTERLFLKMHSISPDKLFNLGDVERLCRRCRIGRIEKVLEGDKS
ncbi:4Fe-4S dicluster domain-containing protein [Thermococcus sp. CX2]|uniref:4Fe-4S dicluster domain-containing protein n=1 Tax=Thermococcus sp. CX2 TaxID=163006 RepID=UPI001438EA70|nr:4Fe-4S dicluster domain-containing protein [Thermococcus sp. CX2]NJE84527.1 4Fe-4S dicluster domain-containing protein [Thermococcus sp. CX2]